MYTRSFALSYGGTRNATFLIELARGFHLFTGFGMGPKPI